MVRTRQEQRRVSPQRYRFLLTTHVMVAVGWLGVVVAKLVVGVAAVRAGDPTAAAALFYASGVMNVVFPPLAIATVVTGILLSLTTKWGLFRYYWVVTKLVLTVAVIATAVPLGDRLVRQSIAVSAGSGVGEAPVLAGTMSPAALLIVLSVIHLLMLGAATVLSIYKPWGKTWYGRRVLAQPSPSAGRELSTTN